MGYQSDLYLSFSILEVSLVLSLLICLWTLCNSKSYRLTWGETKKEKKEIGTKNNLKKSLLLTLNLFSKFCWSS